MNSVESLTGLRVLLTRPQAQSASLVARVTERGGRVCELPLIEIEPVTDAAARQAIKNRILDLDRYHAAIFISTNAARLGLEWIDALWPQLPTGLAAYAVGPGTAQMLKALPWPVHCSDKGVTSEDLLALPGLKDINGQRIALFRGVGGRELIAETLRERGAIVDYLELYRRRTPDHSSDMLARLVERENINAVVVTSAQILDVLINSLHEEVAVLKTVPVLVPSARVRQRALDAGLSNVINAGGADDETVLRALAELAVTLR